MNFRPVAYVHTWPLAAVIWPRRDTLASLGDLRKWEKARATLGRISRALTGADGKAPLLVRAVLDVLAPKAEPTWSVGEDDDTIVRFILPVVTNPLCNVYVGAEVQHLPVGQLTAIAHQLPCSAVNFGDHPRVHVVVDIEASPPATPEPADRA